MMIFAIVGAREPEPSVPTRSDPLSSRRLSRVVAGCDSAAFRRPFAMSPKDYRARGLIGGGGHHVRSTIPELRSARRAPQGSAPNAAGTDSGGSKKQKETAERARFELAGRLHAHMISRAAESPQADADGADLSAFQRVDPTESDCRVHVPDPKTDVGSGNSAGVFVDVEGALAGALAAAAAAGRWDVVTALSRELEARRLAGSDNVVAIEGRRERARKDRG